MKLLHDIKHCVENAKLQGRDAFTILGGGLQASVRVNLFYHGGKGFLLTMARLDGLKQEPIDAEAIVVMFCAETYGPSAEYAFAKEERGAAPGQKPLWHRVYTITEAAS